jgi:hypothetical protein
MILSPNARPDRRSTLIWFANALLISITAGCTTIADVFRTPKAAAEYQDMPRNGQRCAQCEHFIAPNACHRVQGPISPDGWCHFWTAKT